MHCSEKKKYVALSTFFHLGSIDVKKTGNTLNRGFERAVGEMAFIDLNRSDEVKQRQQT